MSIRFKMYQPKVSLIVKSHDQLKYSKMMYTSLKKYTQYPYELVWIDSASTDGTREWLNSKEHAQTVKIFVPKMGIAEATNIGFSKCNPESKYIGDLDNDILLTRGWLTKLVSHLEKDRKIGACAALSTHAAHGTIRFTPKNMDNLVEEIQGFAHEIERKQKGVRVKRWVNGSHTLYRRSAVKAVGLWDPALWMGEDKDIGMRLTKARWKCTVALDTWVYHFLSKTTREIAKTDTEWQKHRIESAHLLKKMYG